MFDIKTRNYGSFFDWPDRQLKERGVARHLLEYLNSRGKMALQSLETHKPDPPDCICFDQNGECIGIEVTELVCEDAVRMNAQGKDVIREWRPGEIALSLRESLSKKDRTPPRGGPYKEFIICFHTDEPVLLLKETARELGGEFYGPYKNITRAFLLFSYQPASKTYPVIALHLTRDGEATQSPPRFKEIKVD